MQNLLRALLTWLDRGYVSNKCLPPVRFVSQRSPSFYSLSFFGDRTLGFKAFEKHVISGNVAIHDKIAPCIEEWVNAEREANGCVPAIFPLCNNLLILKR